MAIHLTKLWSEKWLEVCSMFPNFVPGASEMICCDCSFIFSLHIILTENILLLFPRSPFSWEKPASGLSFHFFICPFTQPSIHPYLSIYQNTCSTPRVWVWQCMWGTGVTHSSGLSGLTTWQGGGSRRAQERPEPPKGPSGYCGNRGHGGLLW